MEWRASGPKGREKGQSRDSERENEKDREKERDTRVREGGKRRDGAGPYDRRNNSRRSDEDEQRRSRRGTKERSGRRRGVADYLCRGAEGRDAGTEARRACATGVGTRAYAQTIPRPLSRAVVPSIFVSLDPRVARSMGLALSFFHRFAPLVLALALAIEGVRILPLYRCRDAPASLADHGRVRTIQGPAGARCYSFRGAQYLGDRQCK